MKVRTRLMLPAAFLLLPALRTSDAQTVATIYGIYDAAGCASLPSGVTGDPNIHTTSGCSAADDTPSLFFVNPSGYSIINGQMVLSVNPLVNSNQTTLNNGITQTVSGLTFAANSITQIAWNGSFTPGNLTSYDYDDEYDGWISGGGGFPRTLPGNTGSFSTDCTLNTTGGHPEWTRYCAPVGNFQVAFTGQLSGAGPSNGVFVSALFAEYDVNGHYSGWEGLDQLGWSENLDMDLHSGTVSGVLANIQIGTLGDINGSPLTGTTTPEPGTMTLLASGLIGLGAYVRRRRAK